MIGVQPPHQRTESGRLLDPVDRLSEVMFGLIMALTITGTLSAATAGREEIRTVLIGVLGCNVAWGLVDAVMFVMAALAERGRTRVTIHAIREARDREAAHRVISDSISPVLASALTSDDVERVRQALLRLPEVPAPAPEREDWLRALGVFLLVFLSTFPVAIPFLIVRDLPVATRTSNIVAVVMLFMSGYWLAKYSGHRPWRVGLSVAALGVVLVVITIALGG